MSDNIFLDTNIVIYLYSDDEPDKQFRSKSLCDSNNVIISVQVINEFINILRKKFKFEYDAIESAVMELSENFIVVTQNMHTVSFAMTISKKYNFSYFDSLIIATAMENGCKILYTEDMQHNQVIDDVMIITNPFL